MIMVASYCRVSTDKDDQANSFASQQRYFKEFIARFSANASKSRQATSRKRALEKMRKIIEPEV